MRIAFIVDAFPVLSETFILSQITGLIDLGHEVQIFAGSRPKEGKDDPAIEAYDLLKHTHYHNEKPSNKLVRVMKAGWLLLLHGYKNPLAVFRSLNFFSYGREALSLALFYKVVLYITAGRFDIIHCHFGPNGNLGALLKELGIKGKLITMFHGYDIRQGIKKGGGIYDKLFKYGDCFLSISDYNYRYLVMFGADPRKIVNHPVGIDLKRFSFRWDLDYIKRADEPVRILTVGRLVEEKGLCFGIEAINKLVRNHSIGRIEYQIVGDGPLKEELKRLVKKFSLEETVHFLGLKQQEEVIKILRHSHLFLLPSIAEALPVVLMEAQAVGLPVVATDVGSVSQVVVDGRSGFVVPERDVNAMADRLKYLIEHPEVWPEMGRKGRKQIEDNFNIKKLNEELVRIYERLLAK